MSYKEDTQPIIMGWKIPTLSVLSSSPSEQRQQQLRQHLSNKVQQLRIPISSLYESHNQELVSLKQKIQDLQQQYQNLESSLLRQRRGRQPQQQAQTLISSSSFDEDEDDDELQQHQHQPPIPTTVIAEEHDDGTTTPSTVSMDQPPPSAQLIDPYLDQQQHYSPSIPTTVLAEPNPYQGTTPSTVSPASSSSEVDDPMDPPLVPVDWVDEVVVGYHNEEQQQSLNQDQHQYRHFLPTQVLTTSQPPVPTSIVAEQRYSHSADSATDSTSTVSASIVEQQQSMTRLPPAVPPVRWIMTEDGTLTTVSPMTTTNVHRSSNNTKKKTTLSTLFSREKRKEQDKSRPNHRRNAQHSSLVSREEAEVATTANPPSNQLPYDDGMFPAREGPQPRNDMVVAKKCSTLDSITQGTMALVNYFAALPPSMSTSTGTPTISDHGQSKAKRRDHGTMSSGSSSTSWDGSDYKVSTMELMLTCPISKRVVRDPVLLIAGTSAPRLYNRESLCQFLLLHPNVEPTTGEIYDEPLRYVDSLHHQELLTLQYGKNALLRYDDSEFPYKYKMAWTALISTKASHNNTNSVTSTKSKGSLCDTIEAFLFGMNQQTIDRREALRLAMTDTSDPMIAGYQALMLYATNQVAAIRTWNLGMALGLEARAITGNNPVAQFLLGCSYKFGICRSQDSTMALHWYEKAAYQDHAISQLHLGFMYQHGKGITQDDIKAVEWYHKATQHGLALAQNNLGVLYHYGRGVRKDHKKAMKWYQKAAHQGLAVGQYNLGYMYENGCGVLQDETKAVGWYQLAAHQGEAVAQFSLGFLYETGRGTSKDDTKAMEWFQKAANQGDAAAQYHLSFVSAAKRSSQNGGGGSERAGTSTTTKSVEWYHKLRRPACSLPLITEDSHRPPASSSITK